VPEQKPLLVRNLRAPPGAAAITGKGAGWVKRRRHWLVNKLGPGGWPARLGRQSRPQNKPATNKAEPGVQG
jgi:hypothetical protein